MINVACATDANFYPFTATMLCSAFSCATEILDIYLLHEKLPDGVADKFQAFVEASGHRFQSVALDSSSLSHLPVDKHASLANYYRLLLPELLPPDMERVLYLDSDLIVRRSLSILWQQLTSPKGLAAVRCFNYERRNERRWDFPEHRTYFNSGVLLIDLQAWRAGEISNQVIARIQQQPEGMELWDQDGLNLVFADSWRELPLEWNVQHGIFLDPRLGVRFANLAKDPAIVHFAGAEKPWHSGVTHPYLTEFRTFYNLNPFKDHYRPKPLALRRRFHLAKRRLVSLYSAALPRAAQPDFLWQSLPFRLLKRASDARCNRLAQLARRREEAARGETLREAVPDLAVQGGPFKGLKYDKSVALGSMWSPKILGCYEAELHPAFTAWLGMQWNSVLDIGCAEGYYAVGLALFQEAPVIAYDIDPAARIACRDLARINGVAGKVAIRETFTLSDLASFGPDQQLLIICDCEGAEKHIFHPSVPGFSRLATCHLLIELHDFVEVGVSTYIRDLFTPTHDIDLVPSVDDLVRPRVFPCEAIKDLSYEQQVRLQAEDRPRAMEWAILRPKNTRAKSPSERASLMDPAPGRST